LLQAQKGWGLCWLCRPSRVAARCTPVKPSSPKTGLTPQSARQSIGDVLLLEAADFVHQKGVVRMS
jgi:hypothetical protein